MYHAQFKFPFQNCPVFSCSENFSLYFPVYHICLLPFHHHQHPPPHTINRGLFVPKFPKTGSCSLVPYDSSPFFPCFPKSTGHPQYGHIENIQTHAYADGQSTGLLKGSVGPCCYAFFFFFSLSKVIINNYSMSTRWI